MSNATELFLRHADRDAPALHFEDRSCTYRELAVEVRRRAALWDGLRDRDRPAHIGVLLDNTPEYLFWLGAAALTRSVVVGINATYRGDELARLMTHSDCQMVVTSETYGGLLDAAPTGLDPDRILRTDQTVYRHALGRDDGDRVWEPAERTTCSC